MEVSRRQGLVAGETIVVQVLHFFLLILALLMCFFHWVYWCEVFHWGGAQLECKVYNWKVHSSHVWPDQIQVTTIWAMDFPIVHFTFYPCKILPESRHQERHSTSIDLVRYVSCELSNCTLASHLHQENSMEEVCFEHSLTNVTELLETSYTST